MIAHDPTTCSALSLSHDEPIQGTALASTRCWLLLEYRQPWSESAYPDCDLPPEVHALLGRLESGIEGLRLQLIRHPRRETSGDLQCFVVRSAGEDPTIYRFTFEGYEALLGLDLEGLLRGDADAPQARVSGPLHLVCTHSRRDQCCALFGTALYKSMAGHEQASEGGVELWQSSHLGGHRFAATTVVLPEGLQYGRLRQEDGPGLMAAHARGEIYRLDRYRGLTALDAASQAAEADLRGSLGLMEIGAVRFVGARAVGVERQECRFEVEGEEGEVVVVMERQEMGASWRFSCAKDKTSPGVRFVRIG